MKKEYPKKKIQCLKLKRKHLNKKHQQYIEKKNTNKKKLIIESNVKRISQKHA